MFGMFYSSTASSKEPNEVKKEKTAFMRLKGLLGLDSGISDEGSGKEKHPAPKTAKRTKTWGKRGKKKKLKAGLPQPDTAVTDEQRDQPAVGIPVSDSAGILSDDETYQDCLSDLNEKDVEDVEEEETASLCFVTPLSSPLSSRPGSQSCLHMSESDLSESEYPASTDDHRSTSPDPDHNGDHFTDSSIIATDDGNDSSGDMCDSVNLDSNGFNDSGVSVSNSRFSSFSSPPLAEHTSVGQSDTVSFPPVFQSDDNIPSPLPSSHMSHSSPANQEDLENCPSNDSTPRPVSDRPEVELQSATKLSSDIDVDSDNTLNTSSDHMLNISDNTLNTSSDHMLSTSDHMLSTSDHILNTSDHSLTASDQILSMSDRMIENSISEDDSDDLSEVHDRNPLSNSTNEEGVGVTSDVVPPSPHHLQLQYHWVLYYDTLEGGRLSKNHRQDYLSHVQHVLTVKTVGGFWSLLNHIQQPSDLVNSSNYHFFKSNIQPMWEDPLNKQGGKWVLTIKNQPQLLDNIWMEMLLLLAGDQVRKPSHVCGIVVSRRKKGDRIALWTKDKSRAHNLLICHSLVQALVRVLGVEGAGGRRAFLQSLGRDTEGVSLVFMHHFDALRSGSSYQNNARITVEDCLEELLRM